MKRLHALGVVVAVALAVSSLHAQQGRPVLAANGDVPTGVTVLTATAHPPMPTEMALVWLAPDRGASARTAGNVSVSNASRLFAGGDYSKAFAAASQPAVQGPLALYALYYAGVSQLRLGKAADAARLFATLTAQKPVGYLSEAAPIGEADARLALDKPAEAVTIYERLLTQKPSHLEDVLMRLGRAAKAAGDVHKAADVFGRVYYEFALSEYAGAAGSELASLNVREATPGSGLFKLALGRAERLYNARQYGQARAAFDDLESLATGDDRALVQLRLAESDYYLKKFRIARDEVKPLINDAGPRQAEAMFFYAMAARDSGDGGTYLNLSRKIANDFPKDRWAEEALNSLGTFFLKQDDDEQADAIFRQMYETFPTGDYAERAAWKAGWRAYRQGQFDDTVHFFEQASADFPRSDYRPSWLYWAARAHERLSNRTLADLRYGIVVADYLNSYYGRLASARLGAGAAAAVRAATAALPTGDVSLPSALPANAAVVKALLGADMFDDALSELRYARRVWGDSSAIQATVAWTNQQKSRTESGMERLLLVRGGINAMRRAYPQFMTAEGESLPHDVLTVIYPLAYWDLIRRYSAENSLDPYLVAALVNQESTFVADVRSHANAYGLMQLLPMTARTYAKKFKVPYSSRLLTDPEANIKFGTAYFADKIKEFGGVHLALASYNAGESPVRRWLTERQGVERDEFIDDIPYPETQGYVRKILGTAEDYRRLYGEVDSTANGLDKTPLAKTPVAPVTKAPVVKTPVARTPVARTPAPRTSKRTPTR